MQRVIGSTALLLAAASLTGCGALPAKDSSRGAVSACEGAIQRQLVSPSSYTQVWSDFTERAPLTAREKRAWRERNICTDAKGKAGMCTPTTADRMQSHFLRTAEEDMAKVRNGQPVPAEDRARIAQMIEADDRLAKAHTGFVLIEYDSDNAMGASVRAFAMCRFGPASTDGTFAESAIFQSGPVARAEGEAAKKASQTMADR